MSDLIQKYDYRVTWLEDDQAFIARVGEFPLLAAHGDTPHQALDEICFVVKEVIADLQASGEPVPEPYSLRTYSGRLNLRMPKELHRELAREAASQNISLNQLINLKLAGKAS